jgi:hypothetical protein
MRLYLDDDSAGHLLAHLLRQAGHDVQLPGDVGMAGKDDPVHLTHAIREDRTLLSRNHDDFLNLHNLLAQAQGHHAGILIVRRDHDPHRDLKPAGIVRAIRNLLAAGVPIEDGAMRIRSGSACPREVAAVMFAVTLASPPTRHWVQPACYMFRLKTPR